MYQKKVIFCYKLEYTNQIHENYLGINAKYLKEIAMEYAFLLMLEKKVVTK